MSKFIEAFRREVVAKGVIQDLESKLPKSFIDFANNVADYASFNVRKLIEKCETFQQLQEVVGDRYSEAQNALESHASTPPSEERFCNACTELNKAIAISIQEGDVSVELSECLVTGMKILSESPGKSRCFNKKQRDKIVKSSVSFFSSYAEYGKMFYPFVHKMGDFNDLNIDIPLCIKKAKGNSLHERVADIIFGSPSAGKYNFKGVAFEKLAKSLECMALPKHPSAALLHCPLEEWFSREVLYFKTLLSANGIKYVLNDPSRMIVCIEKQIRYCKNKPKVIQALQEYNSWETHWGSMLRDAGSDEAKRREYLEKLEKTRSDREVYKMKCVNDDILDKKEIEELQAQVAPVTDAQQNGNTETQQEEGDGKEVLTENATIACTKKLKRKHKSWKSCYAGKDIPNIRKSVLRVEPDGQTIVAGGDRWRLTAKQAGDLFDNLILKQSTESPEKKRIDFSNKEFQRFKRMKCINDNSKNYKNFFSDVIEIEKSENGRKIVGAHFNKKLFSN